MIAGVLPNLDGQCIGPLVGFKTHSGGLSLVGTRAPEFRAELKGNSTALRLWSSFRRDDGHRYLPAALILSNLTLPPPAIRGDAIHVFRNVAVASFCLRARCLALTDSNARPEFWSDILAIHPTDVSSGKLHIWSAARMSIHHPVNRVRFSHDPRLVLARYTSVHADRSLTRPLLDLWAKAFESEVSLSAAEERILRALDLVSEALSLEGMSWSPRRSHAMKAVVWYSAIETLVHPGVGSVKFDHALNAVEGIPWFSKHLRRKSFKLRKRRAGRHRSTAAVKLLESLYDLRNSYVHGEELGNLSGECWIGRLKLSAIRSAPVLVRAILIQALARVTENTRERDASCESSFCEYVFPQTKGTLLNDPLSSPNRISITRRP